MVCVRFRLLLETEAVYDIRETPVHALRQRLNQGGRSTVNYLYQGGLLYGLVTEYKTGKYVISRKHHKGSITIKRGSVNGGGCYVHRYPVNSSLNVTTAAVLLLSSTIPTNPDSVKSRIHSLPAGPHRCKRVLAYGT